MSLPELAQAVIDHAAAHYEDGGWDVVVECKTVEEIVADWEAAAATDFYPVEVPTTVAEAIASFEAPVAVWADRQADARNSGF